MKPFPSIGLPLLASFAYLAGAKAASLSLPIATCEDLQKAVETMTTEQKSVHGELSATEISCDEPTDMEINFFKLKLDGDNDTTYKLHNVRFVLGSIAVLRVDVPIEFTGDGSQSNGGVLNVQAGGRARFTKNVRMHGVGVNTTDADNIVHGGCIYNDGTIKFDDYFEASECNTLAEDGLVPGNGAGLWNGPNGKMIWKQNSNFLTCGRKVNTFVGKGHYGGAIYSMGKMSFFGEAVFIYNNAYEGGAIYNEGDMKFLKRSPVYFGENESVKNGGSVYNKGSFVIRNESLFTESRSGGSGGAIFNLSPGTMNFVKKASINYNRAGAHGGAIAISSQAYDSLPQDADYVGNQILNADFDFYCADVYVLEEAEDDYTCLP